MRDKAEAIDAVLPQTQCGECGFAGCMPYAEALAQGSAAINKCPPGGVKVVKSLAALLVIDPQPFLDEAAAKTRPPAIAAIREADCIGCTKCIQACPVDAIVGAAKLMHVVLSTECTGCGLCIEPCPVDCIDLVSQEEPSYEPGLARQRFQARQVRQLQQEHEQQQAYREKKRLASKSKSNQQELLAKQAYVLEALQRAKAKKKP